MIDYCESCAHHKVCGRQDEYRQIFKAVALAVEHSSLINVDVQCKHYDKKQPQFR